ncbi:hypothetical protein B0H13DRAFT_1892629 [Mycena leptocephala]|nr:hypothetical protein B0H13DRAFT_1892629 [Mycena leptocephala]
MSRNLSSDSKIPAQASSSALAARGRPPSRAPTSTIAFRGTGHTPVYHHALQGATPDIESHSLHPHEESLEVPEAHTRTVAEASPDTLAGARPTARLIESRTAPASVLSHEQQNVLLPRAKHHPLWYIRAVMYLVGILHTRHHVSFSACGLILRCFHFLFDHAPSKSLLGPPMAQTLTTVLLNLELTDGFLVYPICYQCHRVFDANIGVDASCEDCDEALFDTIDEDPVDEEAESDPLSAPFRSCKANSYKGRVENWGRGWRERKQEGFLRKRYEKRFGIRPRQKGQKVFSSWRRWLGLLLDYKFPSPKYAEII